MTRSIDLNCDLGEDSTESGVLREAGVLPSVSSVSVACGMHAGDPHLMRRTMQAAAAQGIAIGAHPSLADRQHFGRRELPVTPEQAYELVLYQIGAADAIARSVGVKLNHVKPHGALYNMAARDMALARAVCRAVRDFDPELALYGLSGSDLIRAGEAHGLTCLAEVFADRTYQPDGSLTPRSRPEALIEDETQAVEQVLHMIGTGRVRAVNGQEVPVRADTVCIHGDAPRAGTFAARLRESLERHGVQVRPVLRGT
ncbi:MAG TPA: 5-oxoprolinase subunit PxpA [Burkholderiales bacterium]|nr:5-oxoprolinase subunit PxpA [Burkholderiales bacterium]